MELIDSIKGIPNYGNVNINEKGILQIYKDNELVWKRDQTGPTIWISSGQNNELEFSNPYYITGAIADYESQINHVWVYANNALIMEYGYLGYESALNIAHNCTVGEVVWFKMIVDDVAGNRSETSWWVKRKEPWQIPTLYTYVDHSNQSRNYYIDLHNQRITSISFNTNVNIVMGICNLDGQNLSNYFSGTSFSWTGDKIGSSLVIDCACSNSGWRPDPRSFFSSILINGKGINITAW